MGNSVVKERSYLDGIRVLQKNGKTDAAHFCMYIDLAYNQPEKTSEHDTSTKREWYRISFILTDLCREKLTADEAEQLIMTPTPHNTWKKLNEQYPDKKCSDTSTNNIGDDPDSDVDGYLSDSDSDSD